MGTRADFYVGKTAEQMEWIGSIAFDGYPDGIDKAILSAKSKGEYREAVSKLLARREDGTFSKDGWPWPWRTSSLTDYSYAFADGKVWGTNWDGGWSDASAWRPEDKGDEKEQTGPAVQFPDMTERQRVTYGKRSGLIVIKVCEEGEHGSDS